MKDSEVLRKARDLISTPDKWAQSTRVSKQGGMCLIGACQQAQFGCPYSFGAGRTPAIRALEKALGVEDWWFLADWNNRRGRSHAEIMSLMGRAIDLAESHEASEQFAPAPECNVIVPA